jgi:glycosyltransferase involved in cell wall biosynthesis
VGRSLLFVAQYYPPSEMVASRRAAGFVRYLDRLGHRVTVVTSRGTAEGPARGPGRVIRTPDLMSSRLNWRRGNFQAYTGQAAEAASYTADASALARLIVPDVAAVTWMPFLLPMVERLARRERFDCVITSSGPESAHAAGLLLRRRGIGWIADLRDGWTFESIHAFSGPLAGADLTLERAVMTRADVVTAVSDPIAEDLRKRYGIDARTLTNGYDPEAVGLPAGSDLPLEEGSFTLVHTGRIGGAQRTLRPLLEAMERLGAARLRLVLAGPLTPDEIELVRASGVADAVSAVGVLAHARALELQRRASALLLLTSGTRRGEVTGKLFEYLAAQRPILALGEGSEAARIVSETGSGEVAPADDPAAIAERLTSLMEGRPGPRAAPPSGFSYPELAERLAELVELAVERAARRKRRP